MRSLFELENDVDFASLNAAKRLVGMRACADVAPLMLAAALEFGEKMKAAFTEAEHRNVVGTDAEKAIEIVGGLNKRMLVACNEFSDATKCVGFELGRMLANTGLVAQPLSKQ
jgi:hypothetical protein